MTIMLTASGRTIDILQPNPADITIQDIAAHLAKICRFTGACRTHYSVAQHSVYASIEVDPAYAREALLHDAHEAFIGDWSSPLKAALRFHTGIFDELEELWMRTISERFNLRVPLMSSAVKEVDLRLLATEKRDLLPAKNTWIWEPISHVEPYPWMIVTTGHHWAEDSFLSRAADLGIT